MKVISLWQPWASLVVLGHKKIETRGFDTKYRGPLLIHAAKTIAGKSHLTERCEPFTKCLPVERRFDGHDGSDLGLFTDWNKLPFGAIIGMVNVMDTCRSEALDDMLSHLRTFCQSGDVSLRNKAIEQSGRIFSPKWAKAIIDPDQERAFGDYSPGRYGWLLSDPLYFKDPIPAKGMQGFWKPDEATELICKIAIARAKINPQP